MTWLTTAEAAVYLRKNADEVRRAAKSGTIPAHRPSAGADWRYDTDELDAYLRGDRPQVPRRITTGPGRRKRAS